MSRQCRICLDTNDPNEMIAPCECRGTAKFIHKTCLQQYIRHFPDGVCSVCKNGMIPMNKFQILFYLWFFLLISLSTVPLQTKLFYGVLITLVFLYTPVRNLASYWMLLVSLPFIVVDKTYIVILTLITGVLAGLFTINHYIPIHYLMLTMSVCITSLYATILALYVVSNTDVYITACFIGFVALLWRIVLHLRPPLDAIT